MTAKTTYTLSLTPIGGFTPDVTLAIADQPGIATSFYGGLLNSSKVIVGGSGTATLFVFVDGSAQLGTHNLALTATAAGVTRTYSVPLIVQ